MKRKLFSILLTLAMVVTMMPMATMTAFAAPQYTYELPEGFQICDANGDPVESSAEMGDAAPWKVLDFIVYIYRDELVLKGTTSLSEMEINPSKVDSITLDGLNGPISVVSYPDTTIVKPLKITVKGENQINNIDSINTFVAINGSGTLDLDNINTHSAPLVLSDVKINIHNSEDALSVYPLNGAVVYCIDATLNVVSDIGVPIMNGKFMLDEYSVLGKKNAEDSAWETASVKINNHGRTVVCIGEEECRCYTLKPTRAKTLAPSFGVTKSVEKEAAAVKAVKASLTKATTYKNGKIKLTFKRLKLKDGTKVSSYQIYRSTSKKFNKNLKKYTIKRTKNTKNYTWTNAKNLKKGKMYYYKVRGKVKLSDGSYAYTDWSTYKTATCKKTR